MMKKIILSQQDPIEDAIPPLTKDQFFTLVDALDLEDNATIDDVISKVLELVETVTEDETKHEETPVAASELQTLRQKAAAGEEALKRLERIDAEKIVDNAIRRGKVLAAKREELVNATIGNPDGMKLMFSHIPDETAVSIREKGRGGSDEARGAFEGTGWVR